MRPERSASELDGNGQGPLLLAAERWRRSSGLMAWLDGEEGVGQNACLQILFPSLHFSFLLMTQDAPSFLATIACVFLFSWPLQSSFRRSKLSHAATQLDLLSEVNEDAQIPTPSSEPIKSQANSFIGASSKNKNGKKDFLTSYKKLHYLVIESLGASLVVLCIVSCWQAGYAVVAAAAPWIFILVPKLIPTLLCSCNVLILILTGMFQQYWVYQVKKVRLQGYYSFSQRLKHIAQLPFATITYGTAMMLLVLVWQPYIKILSVETLLRIVMLVEVICAGCFMSVYVGYIHQYNSLDGQPDILKSLYSALQPSSSLEDRRYYDGGRLSDQQMALLQYQRENLHYLNEEVATELAN
ncbi:hypothetical protein ZIOFF_041897 [Zingiber officinale]|uniref:Transmembrane protein 192 n=1 Tax=Zingiber officinale TaxID=94328 RepID=A0A8J5G8E1_ZINOF|nr:hypothetical protein ZIOFF_041897 [Zingiber officinale]